MVEVVCHQKRGTFGNVEVVVEFAPCPKTAPGLAGLPTAQPGFPRCLDSHVTAPFIAIDNGTHEKCQNKFPLFHACQRYGQWQKYGWQKNRERVAYGNPIFLPLIFLPLKPVGTRFPGSSMLFNMHA